MWLVDTSVWIDHLRHGKPVACGNLKDRTTILLYLKSLPFVSTATDEELLHLVERLKLWGRGIAWVDAHLLASAALTNPLPIVDV